MELDLLDEFFSKNISEHYLGDSDLVPFFSLPEPDLKFNDPLDLDRKGQIILVGCNCTKTKCLKLYCECFANGHGCSIFCKCRKCSNKEKHKERETAKHQALVRNPNAFKHSRLTGTRGCKCKRSGCRKKYCECFLNGIGCNSSCACENCKNFEIK